MRNNIKFCVIWVLVNSMSAVVGSIINFVIYLSSDFLRFFDDTWDTIEVLGMFLMALIFSALFGIAQWLVLRKRLNNPKPWILLTILGSISGAGLVFVLSKFPNLVSLNLSQAFFGGIIGLSIGTAQWLVLKRQTSQAAWWILISGISASASVLADYECNCGIESPIAALFVWGSYAIVYVGVYSLISGVFLGIITSPNNLIRSDKNSIQTMSA